MIQPFCVYHSRHGVQAFDCSRLGLAVSGIMRRSGWLAGCISVHGMGYVSVELYQDERSIVTAALEARLKSITWWAPMVGNDCKSPNWLSIRYTVSPTLHYGAELVTKSGNRIQLFSSHCWIYAPGSAWSTPYYLPVCSCRCSREDSAPFAVCRRSDSAEVMTVTQ
jgi:hypothetical protein